VPGATAVATMPDRRPAAGHVLLRPVPSAATVPAELARAVGGFDVVIVAAGGAQLALAVLTPRWTPPTG
jgi:hypothetical protein